MPNHNKFVLRKKINKIKAELLRIPYQKEGSQKQSLEMNYQINALKKHVFQLHVEEEAIIAALWFQF